MRAIAATVLVLTCLTSAAKAQVSVDMRALDTLGPARPPVPAQAPRAPVVVLPPRPAVAGVPAPGAPVPPDATARSSAPPGSAFQPPPLPGAAAVPPPAKGIGSRPPGGAISAPTAGSATGAKPGTTPGSAPGAVPGSATGPRRGPGPGTAPSQLTHAPVSTPGKAKAPPVPAVITPAPLAAQPPPPRLPTTLPPPPPAVTTIAPPPQAAVPYPAPIRVLFEQGTADLTPADEARIRDLARAIPGLASSSISVLAYAAGKPDDPSTARRLSLSRGMAVRAVLLDSGIPSSQIYVRALGSPATSNAVDGPPNRVELTVARIGTVTR